MTVTKDRLVVEPQGLDQLWALCSRLEVPLDHVRGAALDPNAVHRAKGMRAPGTAVPGRMWAGTFRHRHRRPDFWDVHRGEQLVRVDLHDEQLGRLFLGVQDGRALVRDLAAALGAQTEGGGFATTTGDDEGLASSS